MNSFESGWYIFQFYKQEKEQGNTMIEAGVYKGRVLKDSVQLGKSSNGTPQVSVVVDTKEVGPVGVALYMSANAAPHSIARLRACGWEGQSFSDLSGIDKNEIMIRISYETFTDQEGSRQVMKSEILSGGGGLSPATSMQATEFDALVKATTGLPIGGGATAPKPKF